MKAFFSIVVSTLLLASFSSADFVNLSLSEAQQNQNQINTLVQIAETAETANFVFSPLNYFNTDLDFLTEFEGPLLNKGFSSNSYNTEKLAFSKDGKNSSSVEKIILGGVENINADTVVELSYVENDTAVIKMPFADANGETSNYSLVIAFNATHQDVVDDRGNFYLFGYKVDWLSFDSPWDYTKERNISVNHTKNNSLVNLMSTLFLDQSTNNTTFENLETTEINSLVMPQVSLGSLDSSIFKGPEFTIPSGLEVNLGVSISKNLNITLNGPYTFAVIYTGSDVPADKNFLTIETGIVSDPTSL